MPKTEKTAGILKEEADKELISKKAMKEESEEKGKKVAKAAVDEKIGKEEKEAKVKIENKEAKVKLISLKEEVAKGILEEKPGTIGEQEAKKSPAATAPARKELVAIANVYSSKNNTLITITDISGSETLACASGGMVVKSGREERTPFTGMQLAKLTAEKAKEKGVTTLDIMLRGKGGHAGQKTPGRAVSAVIKAFASAGLRIRRIEDVTPIPHGGSKPPGGKRGRRV